MEQLEISHSEGNGTGAMVRKQRTVLLQSPDDVQPYVHQVYPERSPESYESLKESIQAKGILDPLFLDGQMAIVDGHHRVRAWIDLLRDGIDISPVAAHVFDDTDPLVMRELAYDLNNTRQMTPDEKRGTIENFLRWFIQHQRDTGVSDDELGMWSDQRIADKLNVSEDTVRDERQRLENATVNPLRKTKYVLSERRNPGGIGKYEMKQERAKLGRGNVFQPSSSGRPDQQRKAAAPKVKVGKTEYTEKQAATEIRRLRKEAKAAEALEKQLQAQIDARVEQATQEYVDEIARIQARHDEDEQPVALAEIPAEVWAAAYAEAKSARLKEVAKGLNQIYGRWPRWMNEYLPGEGVAAIGDMQHREELTEALRQVADWLQRLVDELEDQG